MLAEEGKSIDEIIEYYREQSSNSGGENNV